jgi:CBS domain-containing protein
MSTTAPEPQHEFVSLLMVRVGEVSLREPFFVDGALDLVTLCRQLSERGLADALVRDGERLGMFTTTDLRDALLHPLPPSELPVRDVAHFDLIEIHPERELFEALLLMLRHRVHRIVVRDGDVIHGVLNQLDLMSFISKHSAIVAVQIDDAATLAELKDAAVRVDALIALLHRGGAKIELIAGLVTELNRRLFARAWSLLAPAELVAHSCLLVMGSEGRGEQILKTDQDNALLLRDGHAWPGLDALTERFTAALLDFGYPRCRGNIMLSNPLWRQPLSDFKQTLRGWMFSGDADGALNLAIFLDAAAVAGDAGLLNQARRFVDEFLVDNDAFFARFAGAADQFSGPGGWWANLATWRWRDEQAFDLKKLGTFPIVHGVRTLALQHHVAELGTAARLQALADRQHLPQPEARDLLDALHFLMRLKLDNNLRQRQAGQPSDNLVRMSALGTLERDQLHDSLAIIKRFRQHLRQHYKLESL